MDEAGRRFTLLPGTYAVCRLDARAALPPWAEGAGFVSCTRTADELSVICEAGRVPEGIAAERGWRCLGLDGPLEFSLTGIVASFSGALARVGCPVMVVCTHDTDYLLVREGDLERAGRALEGAGYRIVV